MVMNALLPIGCFPSQNISTWAFKTPSTIPTRLDNAKPFRHFPTQIPPSGNSRSPPAPPQPLPMICRSGRAAPLGACMVHASSSVASWRAQLRPDARGLQGPGLYGAAAVHPQCLLLSSPRCLRGRSSYISHPSPSYSCMAVSLP